MRDRLPQPGKEGHVKLTNVTVDSDGTIHGKINFDDGATQEGSTWSKDNVLPDDVAAALALTGNPQVKDALLALYGPHNKPRVTGQYTGIGTSGASNPTTIALGFKPSFFYVCFARDVHWAVVINDVGFSVIGNGRNELSVSYSNGNLMFYSTVGSQQQLNELSKVYNYVAFK